MKKSIFLFFAAILCAMTANAQLYLRGGFNNWNDLTADYQFVSNVCELELPGLTTYEFKIADSGWGTNFGGNHTFTATATKTLTSGGGNMKITTTIPGTYRFEFVQSTKKLTVTYPTAPAPHDITVRAQVPAHWTNDIYAHVWTSENASGSDVGPLTKNGDYYEVTKNAGALYVIFKNGSAWSDKNQTVDLCYTEDVCLQINQSGTAKATATVIECGAVAKDITVKAVVPGAWEDKITAWVWPTGGDGKEVTATKEGNWYVVTENCIELNVIFKNGEGWKGNEHQTANIEKVSENTCYQISALNKDGEGKCTYTVVDCEAAIEPEAKPVDVYTVVGSDVLLGTAWDLNNADNEMTKQDDGSYVLVKENVDLATTGTYEYKVVKNHSWDWKGVNEGNNLTLTGVDVDGTYNVTFTLNKELNALTASLELVEAKKVIPECYVAGDESLTGQNWNAKSVLMTYDEATEVYTATLTAVPAGTHNMKVVYGGEWLGFDHLATPAPANVKEGDDKKIQFTLAEAGDVTVTYHATNGIGLTGNFAVPETKYYIAGTENLTGFDWKENGLQLTKDGDLYKHTFSALAAGTYEFKVTNGTWTDPWGYSNLSAAYEEVSEGTDGEGNPNGNIKFTTEEAKNITVIFEPATGKITIDGLTEKAPAEPVTVYFINSGNWAEVACYYWGGTDAPAWPGVQMTANGEVFEAEGWNVYKITFPGDNTNCIFNNNNNGQQTGDLEVHDGQYYCYANGIWYERLADVDPLDTRVYLKGDMNEWCTIEGWCDMFRKENVNDNVAYRIVYLEEANKTYEFKIEDAGAWLSNTGTMTKDNCTDWTFEESVSDNAKFTTEYVGEYTFVWDMTTKKLSVVYPELTPEVMDLMVTDMVFDGNNTFSGTDNMMGIEFALVVGSPLEDGVFSLDASSTVNFGGTLFTDVTGMIAPDMDNFASASAIVYGFYMGMYFQLNVEMSAGGAAGVPVEILDGTASVNGAGELTISATWDGDDVYVMAPGFNGESYECGTTWETASIIAFGPATITVDGNDVLVEGTVTSGMTGTNYDLYVIGTFPAEETPDYTRTVSKGSLGTICLPNGSDKFEGAEFYALTYKKDGYIYAVTVNTLEAGVPYVFKATSTELKVYYNTKTASAAGSANGLYGTFSDITDGDAGTTDNVLEGNYLLVSGNKVQKCGGNCSLAANRAYFVVSEISDVEQQSAPGRKQIALGYQEENQATGVDNITENGVVAPAMQGTYDILGRQLSEPAANGFYIINGKKMFVVK